jgi:hypothetical protein
MGIVISACLFGQSLESLFYLDTFLFNRNAFKGVANITQGRSGKKNRCTRFENHLASERLPAPKAGSLYETR